MVLSKISNTLNVWKLPGIHFIIPRSFKFFLMHIYVIKKNLKLPDICLEVSRNLSGSLWNKIETSNDSMEVSSFYRGALMHGIWGLGDGQGFRLKGKWEPGDPGAASWAITVIGCATANFAICQIGAIWVPIRCQLVPAPL